MALSKARIVAVGETPYAHEREGIEFAEKALPDTDPYHVWALVDLLDPTTGRQHEIDLVVLGYSAIYLVELKAYPGQIEGDDVDWIWVTPEGRRLFRENPRGLAKRKAQILKSRLERALDRKFHCPWVEPLIFLTDANVKLGLKPEGLFGVVRRNNFVEAVTRHEFPGADTRHQGRAIDRPTARAVVQAMSTIGFRPRKGKLTVGSYELGKLIDETATFQDREATHKTIPSQRRRARTYLVPDQTGIERRQQLLRAAEREAQLLHEVREHPNILSLTDYVSDAPLGPTVLLDDFERGIPLDAFMRAEPQLPFSDRIDILAQLAGALKHCHNREIVHGGLCPSAVLVRRDSAAKAGEPGKIETRLYNFQLGGSQAVEATKHWSQLAMEAWAVYQAPELRTDPTQRTVESDLFSLGAIGFLLLTNQPPGNTVAEVEARMKPRRCLNPRDVSDSVAESLSELIEMATSEVVAQRPNDANDWIEMVIDSATTPVVAEELEAERSPLDARKDDVVGGYKVIRVLGHGASARVLEVELDTEESSAEPKTRYALKVSLGTDHDERIKAEGHILDKLRHPRIVRFEKQLTIAGRPCILMSLAGESLQLHLADHGPPSLDFACRYGADLLGALAHLEERDVLHRDIKPANVGVGAVSKKLSSLNLFDFSLAGIPLTDVGVGTAAYRDPFLSKRGRWDFAADRYSAAVTLYELLTGQRPTFDDGKVSFSAERLDASVRGSLVAFFQTAFAADAASRLDSATAMLREWERAFEATPEIATSNEPDAPTTLSDEQLAALPPTTPIQALPLTNRAKNALDRAGFLALRDLRDLPQNRLSAMRGVGRLVAKDILEFRERWERVTKASPQTSEPAFFPGYRGADSFVAIALADLPKVVTGALVDSGLRTLGQIALAPRTRVAALAQRHRFEIATLTTALSREDEAANAHAKPTTIDAWIDALLPTGKKKYQYARALYGLELKQYAGVRELAIDTKLTTAAIYAAIGKCRIEWAEHPAIADLVGTVHAILDRAGGALSLAASGTELLTQIAHGDAPEEEARAAALVRIVVELDKDVVDGVRLVRVSKQPWLVRNEEMELLLEKIGNTADELAAKEPLVGPAEAHRTLAELVGETALAKLPADRLVRLAAAASQRAAASSRLELYPRGMDAKRALELASAILPPRITEDELREHVMARYPNAGELPARPGLYDLVETATGLKFVSSENVFARPGVEHRTSMHTNSKSYTRLATVSKSGPTIDSRTVEVHEFDDRLKACLERRELLVVTVSADRAIDAEEALAKRFAMKPRSFDALFLEEIERQMSKGNIKEQLVYDTDGGGIAAQGWANLLALAKRTAKEIAADLLPAKHPLLITQPGLIDRYTLVDFLLEVVNAARGDESEAIVMLVPGHEGGVPMIGKTMIPDLLPGQSTWIPKSWIGAQLGTERMKVD